MTDNHRSMYHYVCRTQSRSYIFHIHFGSSFHTSPACILKDKHEEVLVINDDGTPTQF